MFNIFKNISKDWRIIISTIILFSFHNSNSQDVKFTASAPKAVENGQQFKIVYSINEEGSNLNIPELSDFEFLGGPHTSQSSSFSMINGKTTHSVNISYTLYFKAVKEGTFTVPPATIKVNKKTYESNSLTIEVIKSSTNIQPSQPQQKQNLQDEPSIGDNEALFMKIFTDKKEAFIGEQIIATIKLFSKYQIEDNESPKMPSYQGFFKQDIETESRLEQENVNGQVYLTAILQRVILFPQHEGKIVIDPASITLVLLQRVQSRFGFPQYKRFSQNVESNKVTINVKPLPANKPLYFEGAVGNFSLTGSVNKTEAKTNDAITFKITLNGKGNIKLIDAPKLQLPPDFETYEPKISTNISNTIAGQSGSKTFEYLTVPRYAGEYRVDPVSLSYFDPATGNFKTIKTPEFNLTVLKGDDTISAPVVVGLSKEDIKFIGSDIRYIKTKTKFRSLNSYLFGSIYFYLSYPTMLVIMFLLIVMRRNHIKKNKNIWLVKNKKANKMAGKRLRSAYTHMKNEKREEFFEEIVKALWGYISDKLSIVISDLSKDRASELLAKHSLDKDLIKSLMVTIDECEFARYAPPSETVTMKDQYNKAVKVISEIEQKIR